MPLPFYWFVGSIRSSVSLFFCLFYFKIHLNDSPLKNEIEQQIISIFSVFIYWLLVLILASVTGQFFRGNNKDNKGHKKTNCESYTQHRQRESSKMGKSNDFERISWCRIKRMHTSSGLFLIFLVRFFGKRSIELPFIG